ncbi:LON peptidase substrate-binding domain-containing protein [Blastococcus sp. URHD0036]|uniref:LON peptidase substrate-binding domain-containing protein n=1 Tax=Blastococcus sp. URHD0036 TaxID=1380356 RepID=UPI000497326F|nr:LON peptidase substrate-binding domain-containing protein [Blastococcus sp. URHD0036]
MGQVIPLFPLGTPLFPGVVLPLRIFEPRYRRLMRDLLVQRAEERTPGFFGVVAIRQGWEVERVAPAEALYDIGCTARLQSVRPLSDGGFHVATVGGDRFRLLDVLVGDDPPYLQAEVEWLAEEEAAEEAAGDAEGMVGLPGEVPLGPPDEAAAAGLDELVSSVARGSMDVLVRNVGDLFARYVAAVGALRVGDDDPVEAMGSDEESAALMAAVGDDPTALSYLVASAALLTTEDRQALLAESATRRRLATESRLLRRELTLLETIGAVPAPLQRFAGPTSVN